MFSLTNDLADYTYDCRHNNRLPSSSGDKPLDGASRYVLTINLSKKHPMAAGNGSVMAVNGITASQPQDAGRESNRAQRHRLIADRRGFIASRVINIFRLS